ncbi:hypothetical protein [Streptomyces sp. NPDC055210]
MKQDEASRRWAFNRAVAGDRAFIEWERGRYEWAKVNQEKNGAYEMLLKRSWLWESPGAMDILNKKYADAHSSPQTPIARAALIIPTPPSQQQDRGQYSSTSQQYAQQILAHPYRSQQHSAAR